MVDESRHSNELALLFLNFKSFLRSYYYLVSRTHNSFPNQKVFEFPRFEFPIVGIFARERDIYIYTHVSDTGRLIIQNSSHDVTENTSIYTDYRNKPTVKRTNIEIGGNIFVLAAATRLAPIRVGSIRKRSIRATGSTCRYRSTPFQLNRHWNQVQKHTYHRYRGASKSMKREKTEKEGGKKKYNSLSIYSVTYRVGRI